MGRAPYVRGWYASREDRNAVEHAMQLTDTTEFRDRDIRSLSGGERQRVMRAPTLAQEPNTLLLDEPATSLDLKHQLATYRLLADLGQKMLVVAVMHDVNLALQFSNHILVLDQGQVAASGPPSTTLSTAMLKQVFQVDAHIHSTGDHPWMTFNA